MRSAFAAALSLGAALTTAGGCDSRSSSRYDEVGQWRCFESSSTCLCRGTDEGVTVEDPRPEVPACRVELDCCYVKTRSDGSFDCSCVARAALVPGPGEAGAGGEGGQSGDLLCYGEALDHGSTEVVPHCPPLSLDDSSLCALSYESCDPDYLRQHGLIACCNGSVCGKDSHGQPVCLPG